MIIRTEKDRNNPYVMLNKIFLNRNDLSWKAKGLLSYLLSLPDDWRINLEDLKKRSSDGKVGTSSGIKELISAGYITRTLMKDEGGKILGYEYVVRESSVLPSSEFPTSGKPSEGIVSTGIVSTENLPLLNNKDILNNNSNNISTKKSNKEFETAMLIYEKWQEITGKKHNPEVVKANLKANHYRIIKAHGAEEIVKGIDIYKKIIDSPDHYFSHSYTFWDFIGRAYEKHFLPESDPWENFRSTGNGKRQYSDSQKALEEYKKAREAEKNGKN